MPNPFPGMNPYLETPSFWRPVHARLIAILDEMIREQLPPAFFTTMEERVYLSLQESAYPDVLVVESQETRASASPVQTATLVADEPLTISATQEEISETYLEIRLPGKPEKVVAAIEVLSPKNKSRESQGRDVYLAKQKQYLASETHLIEIDLLREGAYTLAAPYEEVTLHHPQPWHYGVCLHRAQAGQTYQVWLRSVQTRLPIFPIPLTPQFPELVIDLNRVVAQVYADGRFHSRIDYSQEPLLPLAPPDAQWADALLKSKGLR
jgi:hypothetical protein